MEYFRECAAAIFTAAAMVLFFAVWQKAVSKVSIPKRVSLAVVNSCGQCASMVIEEDPKDEGSVRRLLCSHPSASVIGPPSKQGVPLETFEEARIRENNFAFRPPGFAKVPPSECPLRQNFSVSDLK